MFDLRQIIVQQITIVLFEYFSNKLKRRKFFRYILYIYRLYTLTYIYFYTFMYIRYIYLLIFKAENSDILSSYFDWRGKHCSLTVELRSADDCCHSVLASSCILTFYIHFLIVQLTTIVSIKTERCLRTVCLNFPIWWHVVSSKIRIESHRNKDNLEIWLNLKSSEFLLQWLRSSLCCNRFRAPMNNFWTGKWFLRTRPIQLAHDNFFLC